MSALVSFNQRYKPGTDRTITFSGKASCMLLPGVLMVSDPIDMEVPPFADLAVSLYFPRETGTPTDHRLGLHTTYISKGNVAAQETMPEPSTTSAYLWLASLDVLAPADAFTSVALGIPSRMDLRQRWMPTGHGRLLWRSVWVPIGRLGTPR